MSAPLGSIDREIVKATQDGLPLCPRPYQAVAERIGTSAEEVMRRLRRMQETGIVRRIGAVPNHYSLGYRANGMSVWELPEERVSELGPKVGALAFVSHCYRRPRRPPVWPYNLFAMVHGRARAEVDDHVAEIRELLDDAVLGYDVLYSTQILKKTGLRLAG